jgi:hypothetical protein
MSISVDDAVSNRMGIDNRLSPPRSSISFWVVTLFAWVVLPVAAWRHYPRFAATGNLFSMFLFLFVGLCVWGLILRMRIGISKFVPSDADSTSIDDLRAASSYASRIAVVALFALSVALIF